MSAPVVSPAPRPTAPSTPSRAHLRGRACHHERAAARLLSLQERAGGWEGEVVWSPVVTAQVVITHRITGQAGDARRRRLILRHFATTQRADGGWGLHPASASYRFVTTLVYVAARLLDEPPVSPMLARARAWLDAAPDDVYALPSWGKFWLFLLGLYSRDGLNPCPPELFLLPDWVPVAPNRLYCYTRHLYLGMAALSAGPQHDLGALGASLRAELGLGGQDPARHRHRLASTDAYVPPGPALRLAYGAMRAAGPAWRRLPGADALRRRALARCLDRIDAEQRTSQSQGLTPVSGVLHAIALWRAGRPEAAGALDALETWAWEDEDGGRRYAGTRSSTWDTAFAVQALLAAGEVPHGGAPALRRAHARLLATQTTTELPDDADIGRQSVLGGWSFTDGAHRWPVSDCTAESLSAVLRCEAVPGLIPAANRLPPRRLEQAVAFLLSRQNSDGGFGSYERRRGGRFLERLNPSEMFGGCMTEHSYVECSASALHALHDVLALAPTGPRLDLAAACRAAGRARAFLLRRQQVDGSWPGFWGVNCVYGTWYAVTALRAAGLTPEHPSLQWAAHWVRSVQRADGGWGEHSAGLRTGRYVPAASSLVITTSWAVLALAAAEAGAGGTPSAAAARGAAWLASRQQADGDWPRDSVNGAFFGSALDYRLYNTLFPTWALARVRPGAGQ